MMERQNAPNPFVRRAVFAALVERGYPEPLATRVSNTCARNTDSAEALRGMRDSVLLRWQNLGAKGLAALRTAYPYDLNHSTPPLGPVGGSLYEVEGLVVDLSRVVAMRRAAGGSAGWAQTSIIFDAGHTEHDWLTDEEHHALLAAWGRVPRPRARLSEED